MQAQAVSLFYTHAVRVVLATFAGAAGPLARKAVLQARRPRGGRPAEDEASGLLQKRPRTRNRPRHRPEQA